MGDPFRGVGVREAVRPGVRGRVVSVHRKAVYLDLDGALIAVVAAGVEPGPVHLHSGPLPPAVAGERITCDGSRVAARTWAVRCDVPVWEGALPDPWPVGPGARDPDPALGRPAAGTPDPTASTGSSAVPVPVAAPDPGEPDPGVPDPGAPDPGAPGLRATRNLRGTPNLRVEHRTTIPADVPVAAEPILDAVRDGGIEDLADLLGGRGPGLTPAGDDLLAGLVLAARAGWGVAAEARLVSAVGRVRTTRPSQTFLHWAARGQCLAPAHDALAEPGDAGSAARLEAIGASSGRCLLAGLRIGVAQLPRLDTQRTRAGPVAAL